MNLIADLTLSVKAYQRFMSISRVRFFVSHLEQTFQKLHVVSAVLRCRLRILDKLRLLWLPVTCVTALRLVALFLRDDKWLILMLKKVTLHLSELNSTL